MVVSMRWHPTILRLVFLVMCGFAVGNAESIQAGLDAGIARKTDSGRDGWTLGGQLLTRFGGLVGFGLRAAYTEFDASAKVAPIALPIANLNATGRLSITEIVPSVRIWSPRLFIRLFGQAGLGVAINKEELEATGLLGGMPWSAEATRASGGLAVNVGGGLSLIELMGLSLEVMPLYHIAWDDGVNHQFLTTSIALGINF